MSGDVFVKNQLKVLVKLGSVEFQQDDSQGNPVLAYLQRHGTPLGLTTSFANEGYTLTHPDISTAFNAPLTNEPYSKISGGLTHQSLFLRLCFASGYYHSRIMVQCCYSPLCRDCGREEPPRSRYCVCFFFNMSWLSMTLVTFFYSYDVNFVGMVIPGDDLEVKLRHIGMRDGNIVVSIKTTNSRGEKVLTGSAEVSQPTTVYVFTGQGSQEPGMGMDLYNSSPAARAVWEGADAHLLAVYGFSIVEIVKDNPKEKTIHFGGIKGQAIHQRYMDMTYNTMDRDGHFKTLLFADIDVRTPKYTFSHPNGLLFATQFAQIALVVTEKAAFEDMRMKGFIQKDCAFAGHSLESTLPWLQSLTSSLSLLLLMSFSTAALPYNVERDSENRSNYVMCAVNPSRMSPTFSNAALREVVDSIATISSSLLEIVNYNVEVHLSLLSCVHLSSNHLFKANNMFALVNL